jgi:hypothetical protein
LVILPINKFNACIILHHMVIYWHVDNTYLLNFSCGHDSQIYTLRFPTVQPLDGIGREQEKGETGKL